MTQNLKNILIAAGIAFGPMIIASETEGTQSTNVTSEDDFDNIPDEDSSYQDWNSEPSVSPDDAWYDTHSADIDSIADQD